MLTPSFFASYDVVPNQRWERAIRRALSANLFATGTKITVHGAERLPSTPALLATNSSQKYDFFALRYPLFDRGVRVVTVTKGKNYHSAAMATVMGRTGVIPLASRGYILLADFLAVHGRRPTDDEYRALRDHVNDATHVLLHPDDEPYRALLERSRTIVGHPFDPARDGYRVAMRRTYEQMMGQALRLAREAVAAGCHVQMYPEGTVSRRLGVGRNGAVQLAWALGLPIVPIGISGCPEAFAGASPFFRGGRIHIEIGEPMSISRDTLPGDFQPFSPDSEASHRSTLQACTDEIMDRLNALVDPPYRRPDVVVASRTDPRRHL